MIAEWSRFCLDLALVEDTKEFFRIGSNRKIFKNRRMDLHHFDDRLTIDDGGYTPAKLTKLIRLYVHEESLESAKKQWADRVIKRNKYGSVGFHCYNHLVKDHYQEEGGSPLSSIMGPCMQVVTLTIARGSARVDITHRTTEICKKFAADLVLVFDVILPQFDMPIPLESVSFHFTNLTMSSLYYGIPLAYAEDPVEELMNLKRADHIFWEEVCYTLSGYFHPWGAYTFNQMRRSRRGILRLYDEPLKKHVVDYLRQLPDYQHWIEKAVR